MCGTVSGRRFIDSYSSDMFEEKMKGVKDIIIYIMRTPMKGC